MTHLFCLLIGFFDAEGRREQWCLLPIHNCKRSTDQHCYDYKPKRSSQIDSKTKALNLQASLQTSADDRKPVHMIRQYFFRSSRSVANRCSVICIDLKSKYLIYTVIYRNYTGNKTNNLNG